MRKFKLMALTLIICTFMLPQQVAHAFKDDYLEDLEWTSYTKAQTQTEYQFFLGYDQNELDLDKYTQYRGVIASFSIEENLSDYLSTSTNLSLGYSESYEEHTSGLEDRRTTTETTNMLLSAMLQQRMNLNISLGGTSSLQPYLGVAGGYWRIDNDTNGHNSGGFSYAASAGLNLKLPGGVTPFASISRQYLNNMDVWDKAGFGHKRNIKSTRMVFGLGYQF